MFNGIVNYEKQRPLRDYMKRSEDKLNTMGGEYLNVPYFFFKLFINDCVDTVNENTNVQSYLAINSNFIHLF